MTNDDLKLFDALMKAQPLMQDYELTCRCKKPYRILDDGIKLHALDTLTLKFAKEYTFSKEESAAEIQMVICECGRPITAQFSIDRPLRVAGYTLQLDQDQIVP